MESYGDEAFIYRMVQETPQYDGNDIRNGFADVGDDTIPFCEQCIIENRLYMTIPAEFEPMTSQMIKKMYPYENRPDIVFADEKASKSVNFWLKDNPPENTATETVLEQILKKVNPGHEIINTILACTFFELEKENGEGTRVGYFELVTDDGGKETSDLMLFFPLDGQFIIGSFKCISVDLPEWMDVVEQMWRVIRIV